MPWERKVRTNIIPWWNENLLSTVELQLSGLTGAITNPDYLISG